MLIKNRQIEYGAHRRWRRDMQKKVLSKEDAEVEGYCFQACKHRPEVDVFFLFFHSEVIASISVGKSNEKVSQKIEKTTKSYYIFPVFQQRSHCVHLCWKNKAIFSNRLSCIGHVVGK